MKVVGPKHAPHASPDPPSLCQSLTLGAVSIATRVVRRASEATGSARIEVAAELCGAAAKQRADGRVLLAAHGRAQDGLEVITERPRDLQRRLLARPARQLGMRGHTSEMSAQSTTARSAEQLDGAFDPSEPARAPLQVMRRGLQMCVS